IKLKGLSNLAQWSNHRYKLNPKRRRSDKENLPPTNTVPSPPESPKRKRPRLTRVLSSTLSSFQARWVRNASLPTPADPQLLSAPTPGPASPIPPETTPIRTPDPENIQAPLIMEDPVPTAPPSPSRGIVEEVQPDDSGCAPATEESTRRPTSPTGHL
ncbi:hypothetical protein HWV62_35071, partial [Athelia sp. TMB]